MDKKLTPIQIAIAALKIKMIQLGQSSLAVTESKERQCVQDIELLESLLPEEEKFAKNAFAAGGSFALNQFKEPNFQAYYQQYTPSP